MKIVKWSELKKTSGPFYDVLKDEATASDKDPRHLGCAGKAFLNLLGLVQERRGLKLYPSAQELAQSILERLKQNERLSVSVEQVMEFINGEPLLNSSRILVFNFKATALDIGQTILLRRLLGGEVGLLFLEVPTPGEEAKGQCNHLSVLHSDGEDIFFDGLRVDWDTLINIVHFSPVNMVWLFGFQNQPSGVGV